MSFFQKQTMSTSLIIIQSHLLLLLYFAEKSFSFRVRPGDFRLDNRRIVLDGTFPAATRYSFFSPERVLSRLEKNENLKKNDSPDKTRQAALIARHLTLTRNRQTALMRRNLALQNVSHKRRQTHRRNGAVGRRVSWHS